MESIGPFIGMALLGVVAGWLLGRMVRRATGVALLVVLVFVALQLIGFKVATVHGEALLEAARAAADPAVEAVRSSGGVLWRLATYNLPFTLGFLFGLYRALPIPRRRRR